MASSSALSCDMIEEADGTTSPRTTAGRYVIIDPVARDEHEVVLRAYDKVLQREIALRRVYTTGLSPEAIARIELGARALAQLSHPNVVSIYDVVTTSEAVTMTLELVRGTRLDRWLEQTQPSWQAIVRAFRSAGRGLAAAHRVGLLHRDFSATHVWIGNDEHVCVTDFGLEGPDATVPSGIRVTVPTPGEALGASDQYDFCVALWKALTGSAPVTPPEAGPGGRAHPHTGLPSWPRAVVVPKVIVEALRRGLATAPEERWPTMDALLQALEYDPSRRRRAWLLAAGLLAPLGAATMGWSALAQQRARPCTGAAALIEDAWTPERHRAMEQSMLATELSYAPATWARVGPKLADYAARWVEMHQDACEATSVRGEQSPLVLDLRMACLHRAKIELAAVAEVLSDADTPVIARAHGLVDRLPKLDRCADVEALSSDVPPPDEADAAAVEAIRDELARVRVLGEAGKLPDEVERVKALLERAREIGYRPLENEVLMVSGMAHMRRGIYASAEAELREVLRGALRAQQWAGAHTAASLLVHIVGLLRQRPIEALSFAETARALSGDAPEIAAAKLAKHTGDALAAAGRHAEAEAQSRLALSLFERAYGAEHPDVASVHDSLGRLLYDRGRYEESEHHHRAGLAIVEKVLGREHPNAGFGRMNLGMALRDQGRRDEARDVYLASKKILVEALGSDHLSVLLLRINLAEISTSPPADRVSEYRDILGPLERALGPGHPYVGVTRGNLAMDLATLGELERAELELRAVLSLYEKAFASGHPSIASARTQLASILSLRDRLAEAEAEYRASIAALQNALGPQHPEVATAQVGLCSVLVERGHTDEAEEQCRAALASREQALGPDHPDVAEARRALDIVLEASHQG